MNANAWVLGGVMVLVSVAAQAACSVNLTGNDAMQLSSKQITVPKTCQEFTIHYKNIGKLPKASMGHNVVVSKVSDMKGVLSDGIKAGLAQDYVKTGDSRVLAKTRLLGGGESGSLTFKVAKLQDGAYGFVCTFPGHGAMMRGTLVLK